MKDSFCICLLLVSVGYYDNEFTVVTAFSLSSSSRSSKCRRRCCRTTTINFSPNNLNGRQTKYLDNSTKMNRYSKIRQQLYAKPSSLATDDDEDSTSTINCDIYGCIEEEDKEKQQPQQNQSPRFINGDNNSSSDNNNNQRKERKQGRKVRRSLKRALRQIMVVAAIPGIDDNDDDKNNSDTNPNKIQNSIDDNAKEYTNDIDNKNNKNIKSDLARQLFDRIDEDKDGFLTESEVLSSGFGLPSDVMGLLDIDRDGKISKAELEDAVRRASSSSDTQELVDEIEDTLGELEPLERQEIRLEGFEPYVLVSVLTAEGSFGMISEMNNIEWDDVATMISNGDSLGQILCAIDWLSIAVLFSAAFSTITGVYATTVFALSILYGKTALGMSRDEAYHDFMDATGLQRFRAFQAFSLALISFSLSVLLLVAERSPPPLRLPLVIVSIPVLIFGSTEYNSIVSAARPIFFPSTTDNNTSSKGNDG